MQRKDSRSAQQLRPVNFQVDYVDYPEGSVLVTCGNTRVLCNVTVEERVPGWMEAQGTAGGWVTGEYSLLPRSTHTRNRRETNGPRSRTQEIQRLIGRALRASINLAELGTRTCIVDCDVLQADGGTRTASITGGYVALAIALKRMIGHGDITDSVFRSPVAAISVGSVDGSILLDLCYEEDVAAEVDANFVLTAAGQIVEVQGTAEGPPFEQSSFLSMLSMATEGVRELCRLQQEAIRAGCG